MNTHSWNDFIDKTQGMDKRRKTQVISDTEGGNCIRRGGEMQANWKNFGLHVIYHQQEFIS